MKGEKAISWVVPSKRARVMMAAGWAKPALAAILLFSPSVYVHLLQKSKS